MKDKTPTPIIPEETNGMGLPVYRPRGRPKGEEKVVLKKRVPVGDKDILGDMVEAAMDKSLLEWGRKNEEYLKGGKWYFNSTEKGPNPAIPAPSRPIGSLDQDKLASDNKKLWEEVGRLNDEVKKLKEDLERARMETPDDRAAYWKGKHGELEAWVARTFTE